MGYFEAASFESALLGLLEKLKVNKINFKVDVDIELIYEQAGFFLKDLATQEQIHNLMAFYDHCRIFLSSFRKQRSLRHSLTYGYIDALRITLKSKIDRIDKKGHWIDFANSRCNTDAIIVFKAICANRRISIQQFEKRYQANRECFWPHLMHLRMLKLIDVDPEPMRFETKYFPTDLGLHYYRDVRFLIKTSAITIPLAPQKKEIKYAS